jgi:hypothetical protein
MILNIFSPKNLAKILPFFAQTNASICKILIVTLVFEKNVDFFAEYWQKSQKIVIITSTPGHTAKENVLIVVDCEKLGQIYVCMYVLLL